MVDKLYVNSPIDQISILSQLPCWDLFDREIELSTSSQRILTTGRIAGVLIFHGEKLMWHPPVG